MKRREFCKKALLVGGAVILAPFAKGCSNEVDPTAVSGTIPPTTFPPTATHTSYPTYTPPPTGTAVHQDPTQTPHQPTEPAPTDTPKPSPTAAPSVATIALVRTADRALGVCRAIELLGSNPFRGSRVLLKPNYNSADAPPASTHLDVLRTLVVEMENRGARSITLGERSGMGNTREVLQATGVLDLGKTLGFDTEVFDELEEADYVIRRDSDFHWHDGFAVPKMLLDSECVVQTCNLKTHAFGGHFTMSLKNPVGFVPLRTRPSTHNYMTELHTSLDQRRMIAEVNTAYQNALIVMDGVDAFVDGGPAKGTLASPNVVLAGTDPIAMDAVGVAILRMLGTTRKVSEGRVFELEQIARAVELGLGIDKPAGIKIVTGDADSAAYAAQILPYIT